MKKSISHLSTHSVPKLCPQGCIYITNLIWALSMAALMIYSLIISGLHISAGNDRTYTRGIVDGVMLILTILCLLYWLCWGTYTAVKFYKAQKEWNAQWRKPEVAE